MNKQHPALGKRTMAALLTLLLLPMRGTYAGGPLTVGGPTHGIPGVPLVWDNTSSIAYRVDSGPLSRQPAGGPVVITNAQGLIRVQNMFANWSAVPTANLNINNAGGLLAVGTFPANGDVQSVTDFLTVAGDLAVQAPDPNSCNGGGQSPSVLDADGTIFDGLGLPPEVIGFTFQCAFNPTTGKVISAGAILNGRFQDGINNPSTNNLELTQNEFDQAFTHEFGHFLGLGHSQINVDLFLDAINNKAYTCTADDTAGMPLMFPVLGICPAKVTAGVPIIAIDDAAWISKLYPVASPAPAPRHSRPPPPIRQPPPKPSPPVRQPPSTSPCKAPSNASTLLKAPRSSLRCRPFGCGASNGTGRSQTRENTGPATACAYNLPPCAQHFRLRRRWWRQFLHAASSPSSRAIGNHHPTGPAKGGRGPTLQ